MISSLGEIELSIESRRAGRFRVLGFEALPALSPTLKLNIGVLILDLVKNKGEGGGVIAAGYELADLSGDLRVIPPKGTAVLVGELSWAGNRHPVKSSNFENENHIPLRCVLGYDGLERLEELRQGTAPAFEVQLWPRFTHEARTLNGNVGPFRATVPLEMWAGILGQLRHEEHEVFVIRYDVAYADRFRPAVSELRDARRYIDRGDYAVAIARCRKAVEMIAAAAGAGSGKKEEVVPVLEPFVGDERAKVYADILGGVKRLGNIEMHQVVEHGYSRTEALFAVRTAEMLAYLLGSLLMDGRQHGEGRPRGVVTK